MPKLSDAEPKSNEVTLKGVSPGVFREFLAIVYDQGIHPNLPEACDVFSLAAALFQLGHDLHSSDATMAACNLVLCLRTNPGDESEDGPAQPSADQLNDLTYALNALWSEQIPASFYLHLRSAFLCVIWSNLKALSGLALFKSILQQRPSLVNDLRDNLEGCSIEAIKRRLLDTTGESWEWCGNYWAWMAEGLDAGDTRRLASEAARVLEAAIAGSPLSVEAVMSESE